MLSKSDPVYECRIWEYIPQDLFNIPLSKPPCWHAPNAPETLDQTLRPQLLDQENHGQKRQLCGFSTCRLKRGTFFGDGLLPKMKSSTKTAHPQRGPRCILSCRFMVISCSHFLQPCAIAIRSQCRFLEAEPWLSASEIVHKIIQQSRPCLSWSSVYTFIYLFFINSHSFIHISICLTHSVLKKDWQINIVSIYLISMLSVLFRFLLDLFVGWLMIHLFISLNLGNTPSTNTLTRILLTCDYLCNKQSQNATTLTNQYLQKNMTLQGRKKKVFAHASVPAYGITWQSDITNYWHTVAWFCNTRVLLLTAPRQKKQRALQNRHGAKCGSLHYQIR